MRELKPGARSLALVCMWLVSGALLGARAPEPATAPETRLWLWAWERPEDLHFLGDRRDVGVAYLARTVLVADKSVTVRPRRQPLRASAATPLTAVVRVEVPRGVPPSLDTFPTLGPTVDGWDSGPAIAAALSSSSAGYFWCPSPPPSPLPSILRS